MGVSPSLTRFSLPCGCLTQPAGHQDLTSFREEGSWWGIQLRFTMVADTRLHSVQLMTHWGLLTHLGYRKVVSKCHMFTLVTLGRLTDVSLNKIGDSREVVKNKGSVWVEGERIRSPFLTRRKITQKPNHSRNKFSLHLIMFEIFEIENPANWGLLKTVGRLTEQEPSGDWGLLVKYYLAAIPTFH